VVATITHAKAPVWAGHLRELLEKSFQVKKILMGEWARSSSPTRAGTVGVALFQPTEEELALLGKD
jgi:hypothetical protein